MRGERVIFGAASAAIVFVAMATVAGKEVVLHVREHAGVGREGWPVSGGVPFARGELADPAKVELRDDRGKRLQIQCEPLARWEDGSVKWLLVDFFADMEASSTARYVLRYGAQVETIQDAQQSPLAWQRIWDGVSFGTGPMRAVIGHRFLELVSVRDGQGTWKDVGGEPGEMWVTVDGQRQGLYVASLDAEPKIVLEASGPNRFCVRVTGWHVSDAGQRYAPFVLRVHAYAGKPYLRVFHTFIVSDLPQRGLITGIGLRVPVRTQAGDRVDYGGVVRRIGGADSGWLAQTGFKQQIVHQGETVANDAPAKGYLAIETAQGTVACCVRNFEQLYPKSLEFDKRGLTCWIWPESAGPLDLRREEDKQSPEFLAFKEQCPRDYAEWIDPGTAKSAGISARRYRAAVRHQQMSVVAGASALGLARTHEMFWMFLPDRPERGELERLAACVEEPLLPFVDPHYLDETEVLGRLGWKDRERFPLVENYLDRKLDWIIRHRDDWARWWGMVDFGDVQSIYETLRSTTIPGQWLKFMGRHGWKNSEVDIPNHLMYHYLRSGDRRVFHFYEAMLRHQMDVDTIHANLPEFEVPGHQWEPGQWTRGGQHRHAYNHYAGGPNIGHTWNEGLVNYYFLTGDRRAYDVALEVGEYSLGAPVGEVESSFDKWTKHANVKLRFARSAANAYRNALKCYEATGKERWKREALRWRRHFLDNSPQYLVQQPATFHVTTYLVRTLAADWNIFRDPAVAEELVHIARWHCDHIRRGYDERGLHYPYLACGMAWWFARNDELLRLPWQRYLSECQSRVNVAQGPSDFRQTHFYEFGQLPFFLRACREAGFAEADDGRFQRITK